MQEQFQNILAQLHSAWRFRWWSIAVAWLLCVAGWVWVVVQPDVYQASARVFVDSTSSLRPLLGDQIVAPDVESQLNFVRQSLLGSVQLEQVARENDLHLAAETNIEMQAVVDSLRKAIRIRTSGGDRRTPDNLYMISYTDEQPGRARNVVSTLLDTFVEDTLGAKVQESSQNRDFLQKQIADYEIRLREAEDRLANFKKNNKGRLPGSEGGYYVRLQTQTELLDESRKELALAQARRESIREQLSGQSRTIATTPVVGEVPQNSVEGRIAELESNLENLLIRFTDKHPDVIATREQLADLRERREKEIAEIAAGGGASAALQGNPVYQALQISLNEAEVEVARLQTDVNSRIQRVAELNALINEVPEVEAELARLNRDYDVVYTQYQSLVQSLETATLSNAAQESDQVEFEIIDPPVVNPTPVEPNRARLLAMVLIAGIGAAAGLALLMAQLKPVFTNRHGLTSVTGLPVLGAVSMTIRPEDKRRRLLQASAFGVVLVGLLGCFGVVFALEVLGPGLLEIVT